MSSPPGVDQLGTVDWTSKAKAGAMQVLADRNVVLAAQNAELEAGFDMRWNADMRAIKRWQQATGKILEWPDHADLCVWLLEQLDKK